jgi:hypothetical protein
MSPTGKPEFPPLLSEPGFYPMSLRDIRQGCVDAFPLSPTRADIMVGLETVVGRLTSGGIIGHLWVDGSFMTHKIDPEDTDLLLRLSRDFCLGANKTQLEAIRWYTVEDLKSLHHCHSFWWIEYPCDDPSYMQSEWSRAYWTRQYGFSRSDVRKGIAVIELSGGAP